MNEKTKKHNLVYLPGDGIGAEMAPGIRQVIQSLPDAINLHELDTPAELELYANDYRVQEKIAVLKGPLASSWKTNQKNLNAQVKRKIGVFTSIHPYIVNENPLFLVRDENSGIQSTLEHRQTEDVVQSLHFTSRANLERIIRVAFEFARLNKRKKVTCFTRSDMFKLSDTMLSHVFHDIGAEFPEIETRELLFDEGVGQLLADPSQFDVLVTPNSISDALIQILDYLSGSHHLSYGINLGQRLLLADPVHGSAPDINGQNLFKPQAMLFGLSDLLNFSGATQSASALREAMQRLTQVNLKGNAYFEALLRELAVQKQDLTPTQESQVLNYPVPHLPHKTDSRPHAVSIRELIGVDVFMHYNGMPLEELVISVKSALPKGVELQLITSRGQQIWPGKHTLESISDHIKCRFFKQNGSFFSQRVIIELLRSLNEQSLELLKTEHLFLFNEREGFLMN